jgi:hypothetical protein
MELLRNGETCLAEGLIVDRVKARQWLILTSTPRLFCVNEESKQITAEIALGNGMRVLLDGGDKWQVEVPGKNWFLQQLKGPPPGELKETIDRLRQGLRVSSGKGVGSVFRMFGSFVWC